MAVTDPIRIAYELEYASSAEASTSGGTLDLVAHDDYSRATSLRLILQGNPIVSKSPAAYFPLSALFVT
jgi:hypothetical protein